MTRPQLANETYMSVSYLAQLEAAEPGASPTPETLESMARALEMSPDEQRHLFNLARRTPTEREVVHQPWTVDEYRRLIMPHMRSAIRALDPHLVAYLDERWNVIDCNASYDTAFPGLLDNGNILRWFFSEPRSHEVMIEWESEAALTVSWFRALMGRYYNPDWGIKLLSELSAYKEFCVLWEREEVRFGRHQPYMHLNDPNTGESYNVHVQVYATMLGSYPVQMYLGVRIPSTK